MKTLKKMKLSFVSLTKTLFSQSLKHICTLLIEPLYLLVQDFKCLFLLSSVLKLTDTNRKKWWRRSKYWKLTIQKKEKNFIGSISSTLKIDLVLEEHMKTSIILEMPSNEWTLSLLSRSMSLKMVDIGKTTSKLRTDQLAPKYLWRKRRRKEPFRSEILCNFIYLFFYIFYTSEVGFCYIRIWCESLL